MIGTILVSVSPLHASHDPQSDDTREGNRADHCLEICHTSVHVPRFDFRLQERITIGHSLHRIPMARWRVSTTSNTHPCQRSQLLHKRLHGSLVRVCHCPTKSLSTFTMSEVWLTCGSATRAVDSLSSKHRANIVEHNLNIRLV